MRKFVSTLSATVLAAAVGLTGVAPVTAAPAYVPKAPTAETQSDIVKVQDFRWKKRRGNWDGPNFRRGDWDGPKFRRGDWDGPKFRRKNWDGPRNWDGPKYGWYNGYKGYPYKRRGYRYHDGFWFPAAAFLAGAVIAGSIANNNVYYRGGGSAHVEWCYDRYRSYREWDNTWQPYNGPRRQCISPYI